MATTADEPGPPAGHAEPEHQQPECGQRRGEGDHVVVAGEAQRSPSHNVAPYATIASPPATSVIRRPPERRRDRAARRPGLPRRRRARRPGRPRLPAPARRPGRGHRRQTRRPGAGHGPVWPAALRAGGRARVRRRAGVGARGRRHRGRAGVAAVPRAAHDHPDDRGQHEQAPREPPGPVVSAEPPGEAAEQGDGRDDQQHDRAGRRRHAARARPRSGPGSRAAAPRPRGRPRCRRRRRG